MTDPSITAAAPHAAITQPDGVHPAFIWKRSQEIPSLKLIMEEYEHRQTGAVHYHLNSDNPENVFLVAFRTVPMDSTGVAHILEHTALCGSEKYPVRDPFFMMIRRSLNTFMNAFTSSDWTAYPFASKNRKDFNNLLNVYLDAAFFSRLDELDFAQEGHRLEFADLEDSESELLYKGVVFNEMKGAMSSTNSVLWHTMSENLFPTTTYHYNSGGEPENIPELSYKQLVNFYKSHYHPSNAVFMTFGDIPAIEHQEAFETLALSRFKKLDVHIEVQDEKRLSSPIRVEDRYAANDESADKYHVVVGWLLGASTKLDDLFEAQLVSSVLLDNSASPLMKAIETSDLGSSPSPMCGLEDSNREMSFMAGLEGCASDSTDAVEKLVLSTLESICTEGVAQEQIEAALHQLELHQREISGDSYPYGLQLILSGLSTATHRGDPIQLLDIDPVLEELRKKIADPQYLPSLVRKLLLNNNHRVTLTLKPDTELANNKVQAESDKLAAIKAALSQDEKDHIISMSKSLAARQVQQDDPEVLPKVGLEDVPEKLSEPNRVSLVLPSSSRPVSFYGQGTNGLAYQQLVIELPNLSDELLQILPLYTACIGELGIGDKDYAEVQTWQSQVCGGINCFSSIRSHIDDVQRTHASLTFSSKALVSSHAELTELLHKTLEEVRFDEDQRIGELIEQICARKENSITGQGHSLAMTLASSRMSPTAQLAHNAGGLEGIRRLKTLRDSMSSNDARQQLLDKFAQLHQMLLSSNAQFLLISEPEQQEILVSQLDRVWQTEAANLSPSVFELPSIREKTTQAWTTATQVNFCAKAYETVPSQHEDNASLHVLAGFMRNGILHRVIREQGGAYGGGAGQDGNSASFRFFSYRDPRLSETLDDFDRAIDWVQTNKHEAHQLEEAILGVIATMDKPSSPAGEAKQAFYSQLFGRTLDHRMEFRKRVLATSVDDLKRLAGQYFSPEKASIGIVTNSEAAESLANPSIEVIKL